jgi:hypothetical protein
VESDAFQVQVNQRFPVFFPEKRPFFMEGAGIFTLAGTQNGDQSLLSAVNTRNIVNPIAGVKITGNAGPVTFATLTAVDEEAGPSVDRPIPGFGRNRTFNVGRVEYSLSRELCRRHRHRHRTAWGLQSRHRPDFSLKLTSNQSLKLLALESISHRSRQDGSVSGFGGQARYSYNTRRWAVASHLEHFDTGFQMDTAFLNRVGDTNAWVYGEVNFYPDKGKWPWLRRIQPFTFNQATHDLIQRGDEFFTIEAVRLFFTRQGFVRLDRLTGHEPFAGQRFKTNRWRVQSNAQAVPLAECLRECQPGLATFYDPVSPYQGRSNDVSSGFTFQPSGRLSESVDFQRVAFDRESTGERVYTIHILNTKTAYQFTNHFFLRAIAQFDSSRSQVLTDFLSSYELRPGTVFYAGYGSLIEQRDFRNDAWITGAGRYQTSRRGLFLKASYLYRF